MKRKTVTVIKPSIARKLLKNGYKIVDVKPFHNEKKEVDYTRCVFVFEYADGIYKIIDE